VASLLAFPLNTKPIIKSPDLIEIKNGKICTELAETKKFTGPEN
jgi:hypothetical protein